MTLPRRPPPQTPLAAALATSFAASLVLAVGFSLACRGPEPAPRPKLALLISIDTLRADHLGFHGYPRATSPELDAFAGDAVVFDEAQSTAPWTLPAHGTLLTGRYPSRLGLASTASRLPPEIPTLAEILRDEGWRTAAIVNSRFVSQRHGFDRGFEHFEYQPESYHQVGSAADILLRAAELIAQPRERPLFLFLHLYDLHSDYRARHIHQHGLVRPYDGRLAGLTPQLMAVRSGEIELEPADLTHLVDLYDAQIRELDANLGNFFDGLRERGDYRDAFIALVADHGDEFLEHGGLMHGRSHYRELIRVPLVIRQTGWPHGKRVATPVSTLDIAPTLLSALGVAIPESMEGRDLWPLARANSAQADSPNSNFPPSNSPASAVLDDFAERVLFSEALQDSARQGGQRAARQGRYVLHLDEATGDHQLYDLERDPGELRDIAASEPERAARLLAALGRFAEGSRANSELRKLSPGERAKLRELGYLAP